MHRSLGLAPARSMLALAAMVALLLSLVVLVRPVSADPAGNNQTVKVDGEPFDRGAGDNGPGSRDNEPHITQCFAIDWYGFDQSTPGNDFYGTVTFQIWPPTGARDELDGRLVRVLHSPGDGHAATGAHDQEVYIGEDSSDGGPSEAGLDASVVYDLSAALASYAPHANQGWHVKITVRNEGSQGSPVKHKVVWVEGPCRSGGELGSTFTPSAPPSSRPPGGTIPNTASDDAATGQVLIWLAGLVLVASVVALAAPAGARIRRNRP